MSEEINYKNNPLHGVSLKNLLIELVDHYGFEILFAYLNINCFKTKPSIESSVKFLKKTDWAREKVEGFYLYEYKSLPRASSEQFRLPPRDRIIPDNQQVGEPNQLSLEDAEVLREKRAKKAAAFKAGANKGYGAKRGSRDYKQQDKPSGSRDTSNTQSEQAPFDPDADPWAKWR